MGERYMSEQSEPKWWEQLPDTIGDFKSRDIGGDVIIATVGSGAQNVAIGKDIRQTVYEVLGQPTPDDKEIIQQGMAEVRESLQQVRQEIGTSAETLAQGMLNQMENELTKTDEDETPNADVITSVGDLLLDGVPQIAEVLASLFATPAVGRVVGKAGEAAVSWVKKRFGKN
jgi:paraquat-inducible protein B